MKLRTATILLFASRVHLAPQADAQARTRDTSELFPRTFAAIADWDASIVRRAAGTIATPAQWNRSDKVPCNADAQRVSLRCALEQAVAGAARQAAKSRAAAAPSSAPRPAE